MDNMETMICYTNIHVPYGCIYIKDTGPRKEVLAVNDPLGKPVKLKTVSFDEKHLPEELKDVYDKYCIIDPMTANDLCLDFGVNALTVIWL